MAPPRERRPFFIRSAVHCIAGRIHLVFIRVFLDDGGQGLAEYGLILGFVAVLCVAAVAYLGTSLAAQYDSVTAVFP